MIILAWQPSLLVSYIRSIRLYLVLIILLKCKYVHFNILVFENSFSCDYYKW